MPSSNPILNEAELQAHLTESIRRAFPLLPTTIKLEHFLHLKLGHHEITVDGKTPDTDGATGRYDILVLSDDKPVLLAELKAPGVSITDDDVRQALSYARANTPLVPLTLLTNGADTRIYRTYDGNRLETTDPANDTLSKILAATGNLAASVEQDAIRTLLGSSRAVWTTILADWTREAINDLTGCVCDFAAPIAREFVIPREVVQRVEDQLMKRTHVIVLKGTPLSGITNALVQLATRATVGPTLYIDAHETNDIIQYMANRLTRELHATITKDDLRGWFNTLKGQLQIILVLDGLPSSDTDELIENAAADLFQLVLGVDAETYRKAATIEGRAQATKLGKRAIAVDLSTLSDEEFEKALDALDSSFHAKFLNGAQHNPDLRWPRALRVIAAELSNCAHPGKNDDGPDCQTIIPPVTGVDRLDKCSSAFAADPELTNDFRQLAVAYLKDVDRNASNPNWLIATWGRPSIEPTLLESELGNVRIARLQKSGFLSWTTVRELGPRLLVRVEELLMHNVANEMKARIVAAQKEGRLTAELDHLLSLIMRMPLGEVALSAAIIRAGMDDETILDPSIRTLLERRPTVSRLSEGSQVELLTQGTRIQVKFGKGIDEEVYGNIEPWLVVSHIVAYPIEPDASQLTANALLFVEIGSYNHLLYRPPAVQLDRMRPLHSHDIPGIGSLPCWQTGIVEPVTQALLTHTYAYPDELVHLARYARTEKKAHLAWRVLTVAAIAATCTDENVRAAGNRAREALDPWWKTTIEGIVTAAHEEEPNVGGKEHSKV